MTSHYSISGKDFENKIERICLERGFSVHKQVTLGKRLWGCRRRVDFVIQKGEKKFIIEAKFQGKSGSAEEKIFSTLADMPHWPFQGVIVIGGDGWRSEMKKYLLSNNSVWWIEDFENCIKILI